MAMTRTSLPCSFRAMANRRARPVAADRWNARAVPRHFPRPHRLPRLPRTAIPFLISYPQPAGFSGGFFIRTFVCIAVYLLLWFVFICTFVHICVSISFWKRQNLPYFRMHSTGFTDPPTAHFVRQTRSFVRSSVKQAYETSCFFIFTCFLSFHRKNTIFAAFFIDFWILTNNLHGLSKKIFKNSCENYEKIAWNNRFYK